MDNGNAVCTSHSEEFIGSIEEWIHEISSSTLSNCGGASQSFNLRMWHHTQHPVHNAMKAAAQAGVSESMFRLWENYLQKWRAAQASGASLTIGEC